jgi:hypothetical protein
MPSDKEKHMRLSWLTCAAFGLLLVGCQDTPPPEKTVFEPYKQAVKKAKTVEGTLGQSAERRAEEAAQAETK